MDLSKVLAQLRAEMANLDAAIQSLERLQEMPRRRGRPPGSRPAPEDDGTQARAPRKAEKGGPKSA
ncbi:MAG TPA: hypothetical protein VGF59_21195 [Bryobacteraceae bacterium]|jgi:hypothetical protein